MGTPRNSYTEQAVQCMFVTGKRLPDDRQLRTKADCRSGAWQLVHARVEALQPRSLKSLALPLVQRRGACVRSLELSDLLCTSAPNIQKTHQQQPELHCLWSKP